MLSRKIVIIGPAGTGKTTLIKVFFDMYSPKELLEKSLEPTKGVESIIYSFFDLQLSVFDLAGQDNDNWFNKDKYVFKHSKIIICVLDINSYLKDICSFLNEIIALYIEMKLYDSEIVVLMHKRDLIEGLYCQHKIQAINEFLEKEKKIDFRIKIHTTSIAKSFFFKTYDIISEIIINISGQKTIMKSALQNYKKDLEIILQYDDNKKHTFNDLFLDLNLHKENAIFHLNRLNKLGFVELEGTSHIFKLTERVNFFKYGLELQKKKDKFNKILEMLFIFSNLNQKSI